MVIFYNSQHLSTSVTFVCRQSNEDDNDMEMSIFPFLDLANNLIAGEFLLFDEEINSLTGNDLIVQQARRNWNKPANEMIAVSFNFSIRRLSALSLFALFFLAISNSFKCAFDGVSLLSLSRTAVAACYSTPT